jgi:thiol-disulfide isomerase/thioredoxin
MNRLVSAAVILALSCSALAQVPWRKSLDAAQSEARRTGRLIFVDFYADWCGPCKMMDRETWPDKSVTLAAKAVVPLKLDTEGAGMKLSQEKRVSSLPTLMFLDADLNEVTRISGALPPQAAVQVLKGVSADHGRLMKMRPQARSGPRSGLMDLLFLESRVGGGESGMASFFLAYARGSRGSDSAQAMAEAAAKSFERGDLRSGLALVQLAARCQVAPAVRARYLLTEAGALADLGRSQEAMIAAERVTTNMKAELGIRERAESMLQALRSEARS